MEATATQTHRFTRVQYEQMIKAGIFGEDDRVELIEGDIRPMSPQNSTHMAAVTLANYALMAVCPDDVHIRTQGPIALGEASEPEPDLAIVRGTPRDFSDRHPGPNEIALLIEVADTSLETDRETKRRLYARHGIPEYWIVNLRDEQVEVFQTPQSDDYATKDTYTEGTLTPSLAPDQRVPVADLLP